MPSNSSHLSRISTSPLPKGSFALGRFLPPFLPQLRPFSSISASIRINSWRLFEIVFPAITRDPTFSRTFHFLLLSIQNLKETLPAIAVHPRPAGVKSSQRHNNQSNDVLVNPVILTPLHADVLGKFMNLSAVYRPLVVPLGSCGRQSLFEHYLHDLLERSSSAGICRINRSL